MHKEDFIYGEEKNCYVGINRSSIIDNVFRTCIGSRKCSSYRYSSISANYRPLMGKYKNRCAVNFDFWQTDFRTEVSTVARASDSVDHFNIQINSLSNGYTAVRAWAEGSWGGNYSDPYWELGVGSNWNVYYYSNNIPSKGTNITLNLDNPVSTTITPSVSGKWTPN